MLKPSNVMGYMGFVAEYFKDPNHLLENERAIGKEEHLKLQESLNVGYDAVDAVLQHQDQTLGACLGYSRLAFQKTRLLCQGW